MALTRLQEAWNGRSGESVAHAFTPDGVRIEHALPPARLEGREAIAAYLGGGSITAVPDCSLEIRGETRGEDGTVTVEWTWTGTHSADMPGWPAHGEKVELHGVSVCQMEGDLIREERVYWDTATLLAGAGLLG